MVQLTLYTLLKTRSHRQVTRNETAQWLLREKSHSHRLFAQLSLLRRLTKTKLEKKLLGDPKSAKTILFVA